MRFIAELVVTVLLWAVWSVIVSRLEFSQWVHYSGSFAIGVLTSYWWDDRR